MESDVTAKLLNFTQEPHAYVSYLDSVVEAFFGGNTGNNSVAVRCLDSSPCGLQPCLTSPPRASAALRMSPAIGNTESTSSSVVVIGPTWALVVQQAQARTAIEALQAHPDAWARSDIILQHSKSPQSKFVALQVRDPSLCYILLFSLPCCQPCHVYQCSAAPTSAQGSHARRFWKKL